MNPFESKNIRPMTFGVEEKEPFNSPDYIYEIKYDGYRCIAYLSEGTDIRSKNNNKLLSKFPELSNLHKQVDKSCILDGELVVFKNGSPDFYEMQRRGIMSDKFKIDFISDRYPATFVAFDILYYNGMSMIDKSILERKGILEKCITENQRLIISRHIEEEGIALFELVKSQSLEGIVAKRKASLYRPGIRTKEWIKIKYLKDEDFVICGYVINKSESKNTVSIILGLYNEAKDLIYQGHVIIGLSRKEFKVISNLITIEKSYFGFKNTTYVEPRLVCTVTYTERTKSGALRHASFKELLTDKLPQECTLKNKY